MTAAKFDVISTRLVENDKPVMELVFPDTKWPMSLSMTYRTIRDQPPQYWLDVHTGPYLFNADDLRALAAKLDELNGTAREKTFTLAQIKEVLDKFDNWEGGYGLEETITNLLKKEFESK